MVVVSGSVPPGCWSRVADVAAVPGVFLLLPLVDVVDDDVDVVVVVVVVALLVWRIISHNSCSNASVIRLCT